jgi:hypothetical protein
MHKLRLFQNRVLRNIFMPQRKDVTGNCITNFMICTPYQASVG